MIATLAEFKAFLRRTDTADDAALSAVLAATTEVVTLLWGPLTLSAQQGDYGTYAPSWLNAAWPYRIMLAPKPVQLTKISVIQDATVVELSLGQWFFNAEIGFVAVAQPGLYRVAWQAGVQPIPARVKEAGLHIARHLWTVRNTPAMPVDADLSYMPTLGYAIPSRAVQLLTTGTDVTRTMGIA